jgi:hypothetical protein
MGIQTESDWIQQSKENGNWIIARNARRDFYHAAVVFRKFKPSQNLLNLYDQFALDWSGERRSFRIQISQALCRLAPCASQFKKPAI